MGNFSPKNTECKKCGLYAKTDNAHVCILDKFMHYMKLGVVGGLAEYSKNPEVSDKSIVLQDFTCPYFRPPSWVKEKTELFPHKKIEELIKEENQLPYTPVLLYPKKYIIGAILRKITRFSVKPKKIYIILEEDRESEVLEISKIAKTTELPWTINVEIMKNSWHNIIKNYNKKEFLMLINGYPYLHNDWANDLTDKIQDELLKFSYAENKSGTITLIHPYVYNCYYFEYTDTWLEKLREERHVEKYLL